MSLPARVEALPGLAGLALARVETWITAPAGGGEGWGEVKPCLLLRATTVGGLAGWGEAFVLPCRERAVAEIIHALAEAAASLRPASPPAFRDLALRIGARHRGLDFAAATSAIEMALWDICGRLAGRPLCALLDGGAPQAVPVYGNIWSERHWDAAALAGRAARLVAEGYRAVKIHPLLNHSAPEAVRAVLQVREAVGDDVALLVDMNAPDDPETSLQVARGIAAARPYWFEEPVDGEDIEALAAVRRVTGLRIVTGEKHCGLPHFRTVLRAGAADVLNPDIAGVGGLLDLIELAGMARRQGVRLSPHCWNSMTVAAAAMLHVCAALPDAELAEIYPECIEHGARYADAGFRLDGGHAHLSGRPGLGVEIDTRALHDLSAHVRSTTLTTARPAG
jgi:galactonate dehydratase